MSIVPVLPVPEETLREFREAVSRDFFGTRDQPKRSGKRQFASLSDARRCASGSEDSRDSLKTMANLVLKQRRIVLKLRAKIRRARKVLGR